MSNQDGPGGQPRVPSESWAVICDEFPDLRRWAYRTEQTDRFRDLTGRAGADGALPDWEAFRDEMQQRERDERDVVKGSWEDAYDRIVNGPGTAAAGEPVYRCPARRCARRAQADAPGERPRCDLFGSPMEPDS